MHGESRIDQLGKVLEEKERNPGGVKKRGRAQGSGTDGRTYKREGLLVTSQSPNRGSDIS